MPRTGRRFMTTVGFLAVAGLALPAVPAHADPGASLSAAKKQLAQLNDKVDQLSNQYNQTKADWKAAQSRVNALSKSVQAERKTFQQLRLRVAQLAAEAYKTGDNGSIPTLVGSNNPDAVLSQMSAFTELAHNRTAEFQQYLASAQRLEREQALRVQAAQQLSAKKTQLDAQRKQANAAIQRQLKLVHRLGAGIDPGSSKENCSVLASGKAEIVLQFACAQLGKPYVFGGAGPSTWDCSGITMVAYRKVGIKLNHWVPDQWDASRRVSKADLQPGDLVFFHDLGHVGFYLGNGKFLHAPHTGDVVKISNLSDSWYASTFMGGGRLL
ncbi:C40 family peptidase [Actinoallomurus rhizosphaericola]|uniref:C40 family peptidase n=1 Tax=Actinoallomurus rhizosphaericola TaxID=2952536 RepID=UPI002092FE24|nr:C40 family peptidase [Actinoallomurus rhizosphaericola]MCO5996504.1 NlpC/P60 family protein [Actinoallomurus rhizosphaericola]